MFREEEPISHSELTDFMVKLGINTEPGVCHGLAGVGICELLFEEGEIYNKRLNWMRIFWRGDKSNPKALMTKLLPNVTQQDKEIIENIPKFFHAVDINAHPEAHLEKFPEVTKITQNLSRTIPVSLPQKISTIAYSECLTGVYAGKNLSLYFEILTKAISNCNVVMAFSSIDHTFFCKFDNTKKIWKYCNTDKMKIRPIQSSEALANELFGYYEGQVCVLSMQFFALKATQIRQVIMRLKSDKDWITLHKVTSEQAALADSNKVRWIHIAAQNGDTANVKKLLALEPNLIDIETDEGYTPLGLAQGELHEETANVIHAQIRNRQHR